MEYLNVQQFAKILKITPQAVHKMIARGVITAQKFTRDYMIAHSEIAKAQRRKGRGRPRKDD